ncbi:MAG: radical SAM protein, partial [Planctomycetota bacterium]
MPDKSPAACALPLPMTQDTPSVGLNRLDQLWFQITGTICNLKCNHCFISCSPTNDTFKHLPTEQVLAVIDESPAHGVREFYFTGGEPFMHRDILKILAHALKVGPVTVLSNGT